jgi:uncharacterized protein (TIGR02145 family)
MTKAQALAKYELVAASMSAYADNQLVPKSVWVAACVNCVQAPVPIGTQTWDKCNLNVTTYRDNHPIPQVTDPTAWANLTTGAWCYYQNNSANEPIYGKLYNWYAVAGIYDAASFNNPSLRKQLAPVGRSIPTDGEWTQLTDFLGGVTVAGGKMKETGFCRWLTPNTDATNSSGFSGLPGGFRLETGTFFSVGSVYGMWWSSSETTNPATAWSRYLNYNVGNSVIGNDRKKNGFSVRCLITPP